MIVGKCQGFWAMIMGKLTEWALHEMYDPDSSRRVAVLKLEINAAGAAIKGPQPTRDIHLPSVPSDVTLHTPLWIHAWLTSSTCLPNITNLPSSLMGCTSECIKRVQRGIITIGISNPSLV